MTAGWHVVRAGRVLGIDFWPIFARNKSATSGSNETVIEAKLNDPFDRLVFSFVYPVQVRLSMIESLWRLRRSHRKKGNKLMN
jgi:hypothetical protein